MDQWTDQRTDQRTDKGRLLRTPSGKPRLQNNLGQKIMFGKKKLVEKKQKQKLA